ncbi:MAG: D-alanine--D-alanine ligase [Kiritimatiellae bacterium]|nr:D-alanine--D-alanine ligase [Kiritimatiellia bacterium]
MRRRFRRVAVLAGGPSSEREVSLRSGRAVAAALSSRGYVVELVEVCGTHLQLPARTDAVFIALHGQFGEDGEVQAMLDRLGVPYTGSGAEACRRIFDKGLAWRALAQAGVPTPASVVVSRATASSPLPLPVVVKPTRQGSSVGCHLVRTAAEWGPAVRAALAHNGEAIVQTYLAGRELTVGVLGGRVLPPVEIVPPAGMFTYDVKYTAGAARLCCPAPIAAEFELELRRLAWRTFRVLGAEGLGRVDLRCSEDGRPHVLELNSIPGFTATSLFPRAAAAVGIPFPELCDHVLNLARGPC